MFEFMEVNVEKNSGVSLTFGAQMVKYGEGSVGPIRLFTEKCEKAVKNYSSAIKPSLERNGCCTRLPFPCRNQTDWLRHPYSL